jgi:16S rRNA (uracil1498-N3)-methyltransferase
MHMAKPGHHLFFASRVADGTVYLDNEESRHAMSALRFSPGDPLVATDGSGSVYHCTIINRTPEALAAAIDKIDSVPKPECPVRMCIGLPDKDVFLELIEDCSALGATEIIPVACRYSQKGWWHSWDNLVPRIRRKLIAGIKQSRNPWLPVCIEPQTVPEALAVCGDSFVIAADECGDNFAAVSGRMGPASALSCFVGPPGGFSPDELGALKSGAAAFLSLSGNRLRTELASVVLCGAVMLVGRRGT